MANLLVRTPIRPNTNCGARSIGIADNAAAHPPLSSPAPIADSGVYLFVHMQVAWQTGGMTGLRKFLLNVHLWTGLAACLLLFVLGLTGAALTYETQIDHT